MAKKHIIGATLVAASVVVAGCCDKCESNSAEPGAQAPAASVESAAKDPAEAVLTVNGVVLTRGALDADVDAVIKAQGDGIPEEQREYARRQIANQVAQTFLVEAILSAKAKELGYSVTPEELKEREGELLKAVASAPDAPKTLEEFAAKHPLGRERAMDEFRTGVLIEKMLKGEVVSKNAKDYTADTAKILDELKEANAKAEAEAAAALEKIKGFKAVLDATPAEELDAKFQELAKANSDCPSKKNGGDLGEFQRGMMVPEFEEVAFTLEPGKVSDPVKTKFGWHLVMTTEKIPAVEATDSAPAAPEKVKARHILIKVQEAEAMPTPERVASFLKRQDERRLVGEFIESLVRSAKIEAAEDFKQVLPTPEEPEAEAPAPEATPAPAAAPAAPEAPEALAPAPAQE